MQALIHVSFIFLSFATAAAAICNFYFSEISYDNCKYAHAVWEYGACDKLDEIISGGTIFACAAAFIAIATAYSVGTVARTRFNAYVIYSFILCGIFAFANFALWVPVIMCSIFENSYYEHEKFIFRDFDTFNQCVFSSPLSYIGVTFIPVLILSLMLVITMDILYSDTRCCRKPSTREEYDEIVDDFIINYEQ